MKVLVAVGRIEAGSDGVFDPGTVLPSTWDKKSKQRLIDCGAAEMREVTEEEAVVVTTKIVPDSEKYGRVVSSSAATKEQIDTIVTFWEVTSWKDFAGLSEVELTEVKGVGKATANKILAAIQEIEG